jgi:hypothetical protein
MAQKYRFSPYGKISKKSEAKPIKEAIQSLFKSYQIDRKFNYANIINNWENLMGKTVASRTGKIFIKEQKLFVEIQSAALKSDMYYSKKEIIEIVNEFVGKEVIKEVIFL